MNVLENRLFDWTHARSPEGGVYPVARKGQSAVFYSSSNVIVMFGGTSENRLNDLHYFSLAEKQWRIIQTKGKPPAPRSHHGCFLEKNLMFVYGGQNEKNRSLGDLHVLNLETNEWKRLFVLEAPPPRHQMAMCITFESLLISQSYRQNSSCSSRARDSTDRSLQISLENIPHAEEFGRSKFK